MKKLLLLMLTCFLLSSYAFSISYKLNEWGWETDPKRFKGKITYSNTPGSTVSKTSYSWQMSKNGSSSTETTQSYTHNVSGLAGAYVLFHSSYAHNADNTDCIKYEDASGASYIYDFHGQNYLQPDNGQEYHNYGD